MIHSSEVGHEIQDYLDICRRFTTKSGIRCIALGLSFLFSNRLVFTFLVSSCDEVTHVLQVPEQLVNVGVVDHLISDIDRPSARLTVQYGAQDNSVHVQVFKVVQPRL